MKNNYSESSLNRHSRKQTALPTITFKNTFDRLLALVCLMPLHAVLKPSLLHLSCKEPWEPSNVYHVTVTSRWGRIELRVSDQWVKGCNIRCFLFRDLHTKVDLGKKVCSSRSEAWSFVALRVSNPGAPPTRLKVWLLLQRLELYREGLLKKRHKTVSLIHQFT